MAADLFVNECLDELDNLFLLAAGKPGSLVKVKGVRAYVQSGEKGRGGRHLILIFFGATPMRRSVTARAERQGTSRATARGG
jgi:hypothetical protein